METGAWQGGGRGEAEPGQRSQGLGAGRRGLCRFLSGCWATRRGQLCLAKPRARCQSPLLLWVVRSPRLPGHQVAGNLVLLPVLDLALAVEGKVMAQGFCCKAGRPQLERGRSRATSIPGSKAVTRPNPSTTIVRALGGNVAWPSISPTGRWMQPPVQEAKGFNDTAITRPDGSGPEKI